MQARYQYGNLMLRKRKKGPDVWQFRWMENGRARSVLIGTVEKFPTRADAERAVEHFRIKINADVRQARFHSVTVAGLIDRFMLEELPKGRRFQTQSGYRSYFTRYLRPKWGELFLDQVDPMPVADWLATLPLSPKTKSHLRNVFHLLFQWALRWKMIERNPIELIRQSNRRLAAPRVLAPTEFRALLGELENPYKTMVMIAGCLGLRASEVMGLKWSDVDWTNLAVFIRRSVVAGRDEATKTEASQKPVPLHADLATALLRWRGQSKFVLDSDFIFAGDTGKPRWQGMILKDYLQPAAERAGIGKVGGICSGKVTVSG